MRRLSLVIVLLLGVLGDARPASHELVLVVRRDSPVADLDSITVRKLFLGVPVLIESRLLHPIRNRSEAHLDEIFLQQIVAMSQSAYERQILNGANRQGWLRPSEVTRIESLVQALEADPTAVSFMWERELAHNPRLRIVRVLWSE
jgi:hypothetical protein